MKYYSTLKKKEILPFVTTWMDTEAIILGDRGQMGKDILRDLT